MLEVFSFNLSHLHNYTAPESEQWYQKLGVISHVCFLFCFNASTFTFTTNFAKKISSAISAINLDTL